MKFPKASVIPFYKLMIWCIPAATNCLSATEPNVLFHNYFKLVLKSWQKMSQFLEERKNVAGINQFYWLSYYAEKTFSLNLLYPHSVFPPDKL